MIPGVPYDAEIEYLESTGTQYIDTGVLIGPSITITGRIRPLGLGQHILGSADAVEHPVSRIYIQPASNNRMSWIYALNNTNSLIAYLPTTPLGLDIDFTCGPSSAVYNGISVSQTSWTQVPQSTSATLGLFARIAHATTGLEINYASVRFYSCKITQGSALIRDLIPVRVGQTGYMYDRVSKRLFGNKGTGSFVLGPDVAKPVIGLYGMRKFYNARDYVQSGLIAMWDGIENAGWGVHDGTANKWVDITGNELPLTANQGTLLWHWDSAYNFRHSLIQSENIPRNYSNGYTFELITANGFRNPSLLPTTNIFGIDAWPTNNYYRFTSFGSVSPSLRSSVALSTLGTEKSLSAVMEHTGQGVVYMNTQGRSLPVTNSSTPLSLSGNAKFHIGTRATATFHPPIYAIRLYSRALSTAEIAHNYAIDKARFNLP